MGVESTAAHCTEYQADLFLHPSSNLVSKPLAASLALTTQGASLLASGCCWGFSYPNFFYAIGLPPSGGPILSSIAKKESGKKDATKGGGRSPHLWNPPPAYGVGAAAAHCTRYQADL